MQDTPAGRHSVRRYDDRRKPVVIDGLGVFNASCKMNTLGIERISSGTLQLRHFEVMFLDMSAKNIDSIHCHRAVNVHRKHRDLILDFQLAKHVEQLLRAPNGEGRNQDCSSAFRCGNDHVAQLLLAASSILVRVQTIAVCGFQDKVVGAVDGGRIEDNRLIVTADITGE